MSVLKIWCSIRSGVVKSLDVTHLMLLWRDLQSLCRVISLDVPPSILFKKYIKNAKVSVSLLNVNLWLIIAVIDTTWAVVKWKPEKNSCLNGIRTHDLCDTIAVLYRYRRLMGSNPVQAWIFSGFNFTTAQVVYNCDCQPYIHIFLRSSNIWSFIYSFMVSLLLCIYIHTPKWVDFHIKKRGLLVRNFEKNP